MKRSSRDAAWLLGCLAGAGVLAAWSGHPADAPPPLPLASATAADIRYVCYREINDWYPDSAVTYQLWGEPGGEARFQVQMEIRPPGRGLVRRSAPGRLDRPTFHKLRAVLQAAQIWTLDSHSMLAQDSFAELVVSGPGHEHEAHWMGVPDQPHCDLMNAFAAGDSPLRPTLSRIDQEVRREVKERWNLELEPAGL